MNDRPMRAVTILLAACACLALSCGKAGGADGAGAGKRKAPLVEVTTVARSDAEFQRSFLVTLQPSEQANILSRASGQVLAILLVSRERVSGVLPRK